jgi:hypothetical protein
MAWIKERTTDDGDKRFVACYRDSEGRHRSAGTYSTRRAAQRVANREDAKVRDGAWHDHTRGQVTFTAYVETAWMPSKQVETATLAAYRSYLRQTLHPQLRPSADREDPAIGDPTVGHHRHHRGRPLGRQRARKYHTMLHSDFERALRDRVVTFNPCVHTELPNSSRRRPGHSRPTSTPPSLPPSPNSIG